MQLLEKYIIEHSKDVIVRLANSWNEQDFKEMRSTLKDLESIAEKNEKPLIKKRRSPNIFTSGTFERLFSIFLDAHSTNVFVTPEQMDVTQDQLIYIASRANTCAYKQKHHPDCHVRYKRAKDGVHFELLRKEVFRNDNSSKVLYA